MRRLHNIAVGSVEETILPALFIIHREQADVVPRDADNGSGAEYGPPLRSRRVHHNNGRGVRGGW